MKYFFIITITLALVLGIVYQEELGFGFIWKALENKMVLRAQDAGSEYEIADVDLSSDEPLEFAGNSRTQAEPPLQSGSSRSSLPLAADIMIEPGIALEATQPTAAGDVTAPTGQSDTLLLDIPFTSQAPFGDWSNQIYQDGCEEASVLMVMSWVKKKSLSPAEAKAGIAALSEFEEANYGEYRDSSAADTAKLIHDYYDYDQVSIIGGINSGDIIAELEKGNAVIIPLNGQKLNNPNFTPPGPINHMLVVRGYDPDTQEFITNDPGTRKGEKYRYSQAVLDNALRDYPTGYHEENLAERKVMIVVRPE